ncbi:unnamed protein product [Cochlearia groenlandica]
MNSQPLSNGFPRRRVEKETGMNKGQPIKSHSVKHTENGGEAGNFDSPSYNPFLYLTTCMIGHQVEVHLKDGSVYSGIFHASDTENNFGIVLKMACLISEGNLRGMKSRSPLVSKPSSKIFTIPADELVQVVAKDLPVYSNSEKQLELLTDSLISQSHNVDLERELKPWVPDEDVLDGPDLENVFDDPWKRGWNQFEVNKTLFGVTSTFDEELYTTKLERGPRTRELEERALRIAREIEGENTRDLHVAEERGIQLSGNFDIDEETKYSSVCPVNGYDDTGYEEEEEEEEILLNCCNNLTFGDSSAFDGMKPASTGKFFEEAWVDFSRFFIFQGHSLPSQSNTNVDQSWSNTNKHAWQFMSEQPSNDITCPKSNTRSFFRRSYRYVQIQLIIIFLILLPIESSANRDINEGAATSEWQTSNNGRQVGPFSDKTKPESSYGWHGSSISKISENSAASSPSSRPILSPCSSLGSVSSDKSTLNPNAKEFKLNPNAKSFKPSPTATPPRSPVHDGSFYYPPLPPMPGSHILYGMGGATYPGQQQQPMMYNNNTTQISPNQSYYSPNSPQYTQQRPVLFMPPTPYQQEMQYKGRDSY